MRKLYFLAVMVVVTLGSFQGCCQTSQKASFNCEYITTPEDSTLAANIVASLREEYLASNLSTPELIVSAGHKLLGNEYVGGTLDQNLKETLTLYLLKTDCILFVETCTALARAAKEPAFPDNYFYSFASNIRQTRYRDGVTDNYSDRIHYTTEWIRQAQKNGIAEDITLAAGGEVWDHPIHFMSSHSSSYKQIADAAKDSVAAANLAKIREVEKTLNQEPQYYIPDVRIPECEKNIQTGDIIGYMSATEGLDIAHVVLAYVTDKDGSVVYGPHSADARVGFMHASMGAMKVIIDPKTIADYAQGRKGITGINVTRVK